MKDFIFSMKKFFTVKVLFPSKPLIMTDMAGYVVAQLAKATGRHQTEDAAVPGSNPAPPQ
jgi:hypothetical protein